MRVIVFVCVKCVVVFGVLHMLWKDFVGENHARSDTTDTNA